MDGSTPSENVVSCAEGLASQPAPPSSFSPDPLFSRATLASRLTSARHIPFKYTIHIDARDRANLIGPSSGVPAVRQIADSRCAYAVKLAELGEELPEG